MGYFKLFLLLFMAALASGQGPNPIVRVAHGVIQGVWKMSSKGRSYASFLGIPYARPPIGKYRLREPQQLKPWLGVWDATKPLSACIQYDPIENKVTGSEDCLFVNVHTPTVNAAASLPVLIYIHGGAYMYGTGSLYDTSHFMDRDVVVVTLNYRLGPLGFLSTGDEVIPGNAGLKDQSFAIKWVRDNIMMFGGNPESITLTGCSAGGASVHYHYLSPLSQNTFHRGIAFSGSALASWTHSMKPAEKAKSLAAIVGCPTSSNREMADCLKHRPAEVLVEAQVEMFDWRVNLFAIFTPTAEASRVKEPFLSKYPYLATVSGDMQRLPLITSVTSEEGLYPAAAYQKDPSILSELESKWEYLASNIFEYNDTLPLALRPVVAKKIKDHYLEGKPVGQDTFAQLVQALSDRLFVSDVGKMAQIHAQKSGQPTYVYRYAFNGQTSLSNMIAQNNENYGVSHADDVLLIFGYQNQSRVTADDRQMRESLLDMIYSYMSTGVPRIPNAPEWQQVKPGAAELNYIDIAGPKNIVMKSNTDFGQKSFWDSLGFLENENYGVNFKDEL